jgi:NAD(P)-dependent dehydrogenase (short-subunit alcohol dehydrogenase family)
VLVVRACGGAAVRGADLLQPACHADRSPMASVIPVPGGRNVCVVWDGSPRHPGVRTAAVAPAYRGSGTSTNPGGAVSEERTMAGRTALVTGGSRGIGLAIARSLVRRGARVVLTARRPDPLAEAVEELGGPGVAAAVAGHAGDAAHRAAAVLTARKADALTGAVEELGGREVAAAVAGHAGDAAHRAVAVRTAVERFGSLDMLVGNVGVNPVYGPMVDLDLDAFRKILDTNVVSSLGLVQEAWRVWMSEHGGSVLFVASVAGLRSAPDIGGYGVSKAAIVNLTTQLAVELGPKVRVNAVAPAVVKTRFAGALYEGREAEVAAQYPVGRLGVPEDVGEAAAYLLGDGAAWVTGQTLVLDGGRLSRGS